MTRAPLARSRTLLLVAAASCLAAVFTAGPVRAAPASPGHGPSWTLVDTGKPNHYRGLSVVNRNVVWLGGYSGLVLRTTDGGRHWSNVSPPNATGLQFRDIQGFDANHAVAMAAGARTNSRLYVTADGGAHWQIAYQNSNAAAFFDCMAFFNSSDGLVLSDPVDGRFRVLSTHDGGHSWSVNRAVGMPPALTGEFGFAASGECLTTWGSHDAWFGSGGTTTPRIYHSVDGGSTWSVTTAPLTGSPSGGVFALAFRTPYFGVVTGGDFAHPNDHAAVAATQLFGQPWQPSASQPSGYRSGVTWVPYTLATVIAVGLNGSDISYDGGHHWATFATGQFDTVSCSVDGACWASGDLGRVAVLSR